VQAWDRHHGAPVSVVREARLLRLGLY